MNDDPQPPTAGQPDIEMVRERTKQASIAGWTAGLSAFFAISALAAKPTWAVAAGVAAVAVMVAVVCHGILKRP